MRTKNIVELEIESASIANFINSANLMGIRLYEVRYVDILHIRAGIFEKDYGPLKQYADRHGDSIRILHTGGLNRVLRKMLRRPVLTIAAVIWIFMVTYLPTRVLFVYADGNKNTSAATIIEAAGKCGIHFGSSRRFVRSEKVKNALLSQIPELQWAGVNTYGCIAVISVKERSVQHETDNQHTVQSIIASHDSIVSDITVRSGTVVCKRGQAVRKGQLLVSGFTDCGLLIRAGNADAEVFGLTKHKLSALAVTEAVSRQRICKKIYRWRIQIGKNIIKLYNDSGIPDSTCVKMYTSYPVTLPGGFELPVSFHLETLKTFDLDTVSFSEIADYSWLKQEAQAWLNSDMIAGKVLQCTDSFALNNGICSYTGIYTCEEMISKIRLEETIYNDEEGKH